MGGSAFAAGQDPLRTPRMPSAVYESVKKQCHDVLSELFITVASPIDGPAKLDYGDVDVLVTGPRDRVLGTATENSEQPSARPVGEQCEHELKAIWESIAKALGAIRMIQSGRHAAHLAINWPTGITEDQDDDTTSKHIQVDIRICDTAKDLEWILFKHAHGDIWNLLGTIIRPFGLTVDENALNIRVPEIEQHDKKRARVVLSSEPAEIITFLGLRMDGFWEQPFISMDAMFEYVATCRFFWVSPPRQPTTNTNTEGTSENETAVMSGFEGGEKGRSKLKSNDRRRMQTRPIFRKWVDEFIPACRAQRRFLHPDPAMTQARMSDLVRAEAFARWDGVQPEYERKRDEFIIEKQRAEILHEGIKANVPTDLDPQHRGVLISVLKKIVLLGDESFGIVPDIPLRTEQGYWVLDNVRRFVHEHWGEVESVAWRMQLEKSRENLRLKELKHMAITKKAQKHQQGDAAPF